MLSAQHVHAQDAGGRDGGQPAAASGAADAPAGVPANGGAPATAAEAAASTKAAQPNGPKGTATDSVGVEPIQVKAKRRESYKAPIAETATKTDTPVMETPVSVQVVPQVVLRDQAANTLDRAVQNVSGVTPVTAGMLSSDDYIIRGFDNYAVSFEDGLRHDEYTFSGFPRDLANVERVEVIKGPASILYGQLEPGGLVNVITKKPLDDPFYMLEARAGSFSSWRFALDATGPLVESKALLYRFNIAYENAKSFRDL
jgi:iron complex outermembrane receptor protein